MNKFIFSFLILMSAAVSLKATEQEEIDKKIGQMLLVGFRSMEVSQESKIVKDIEAGRVGGVILYLYDTQSQKYERNIQSSEQLTLLCDTLRKHANTPIFIGIDQEGGLINRLPKRLGFPDSVSAEYLGKLNDTELIRYYAELCATTLKNLGFNLNLAPVVDLNINPNNPVIGTLQRSFSNNPDIVSLDTSIFVNEHHKQGILTALKHFPGHGSSEKDSHEGFVDITKTWKMEELEPYNFFISQGYEDLIMTGHVYHHEIDPEFPATLSKIVVTELLRNQLNFKGVIISDDLQMGAIQKIYGLETSIEKAILAGVDILLLANQQTYDEEIADKVIHIIKNLIAEGKISSDRIEESYQRIQNLKKKLDKKEEQVEKAKKSSQIIQ